MSNETGWIQNMRTRYARRTSLIGILLTLLAAGCCAVPSTARELPAPDRANDGGAEAYVRWIETCMDDIEKRLPAITRSAEEAARLYVDVPEGYGIRAEGEPGLSGEPIGRSGGIMEMNFARGRTIRLIFPQTPEEVRRWATREDAPRSAVVFAPWWMVKQAQLPKAATTAIVVTHHAESGGLLACEEGRRLVPIDRAGGAVALWVWTGEFVAACTRRGKMPSIYLGYSVPGGKERAERIMKSGNLKFHSTKPPPVEAGLLGKAYLGALRKDVSDVWRHERADIRQLAAKAVTTLKSGRRCFLIRMTHIQSGRRSDAPFDPGYFVPMSEKWKVRRPKEGLQPCDLVFCVNFDDLWPIAEEAARMRTDGALLAWSFSGWRTEAGHGMQAIGRDELFIDQRWDFGDAVVEVPGYDIKILPTSGIIAESVLRMVEAEMVRITDGKRASELRPSACVLDAAPAIRPQSAQYAPGRTLDVYRTLPARVDGAKRPAIVLIHGGGWSGGTRDLLAPHARWFAGKGLVAVNISYRLTAAPGVRLPDCVADAQAAVAWVRAHAADWGIDPARIAVAGESAGGHLAACAGLMAPQPARANALILFNPVIDTASADGWRMDASYTADERRALSPAHHVAAGAPPTLVVHGEVDKVTPIRGSERFVDAMRKARNKVEFVRLPDAGHAFLLPGYGEPETINRALAETERWLTGLGYLRAR